MFPYRRLLCNVLIQPHFDYACTAWYPNLTKKLKDKLQVTPKNALDFVWNCNVGNVYQMNTKKLNWLPINHSFKQYVTSAVFKFVQNKYPAYMSEVFRPSENMRINARNSYLKLNYPFRKTSTGQNVFCCIGPAIWSRIPEI